MVEGAEGSVGSSEAGDDEEFILERTDRDHGLVNYIVLWVYAHRDIAQELAERHTQMEPPDILRLRTRCDAAAVFAAASIAVSFVGGVWYLSFGYLGCGALLTGNALLIFSAMNVLRQIAAHGSVIISAVNVFAGLLIAVTLAVPLLLYALLGNAPHASDVAIWTLMAPVAAVRGWRAWCARFKI
jgi:hypothetical protein